MANTCTTKQKYPLTIEPEKADGSKGEVQAGSVTVATDDETVLRFAPGPDEFHPFLDAVAPSQLDEAGSPIGVRWTVTADADLGDGVNTIIVTGDELLFVTLDPGTTMLKVSVGEPVDK